MRAFAPGVVVGAAVTYFGGIEWVVPLAILAMLVDMFHDATTEG